MINVYDNGEKTVDRYTVCILDDENVHIFTMGYDPNCFNQYSHSVSLREYSELCIEWDGLIAVAILPVKVRDAIEKRCTE
jgi:hypothetical protein